VSGRPDTEVHAVLGELGPDRESARHARRHA
jgi:hypothetical protein